MLGLVPLLLMRLWTSPVQAAAADRAAIEAAVGHYFVAGDTNSSAELRQAFHPAAMMFFVRDGGLAGVSQPEWWSRIDASKEIVKALSRKFPFVDQAGDAAVAKVASEYPTHRFHDYMSLLRIGGQWRIVGKIFHRTVPPDAPPPDAAAAAADADAIRATLQSVFAAIDANDGSLLSGAVSSRAIAYRMLEGQLVGVSLPEWQARLDARKSANPPPPKAAHRVAFVDSDTDAAVARIEHELPANGDRRVDYVSLLKLGGKWTVVGVVFTSGTAS